MIIEDKKYWKERIAYWKKLGGTEKQFVEYLKKTIICHYSIYLDYFIQLIEFEEFRRGDGN